MWQRILVRCGLPLVFSGGFNPRPRLSLPLPRAVGVQADEDLLCAETAAGEQPAQDLAARINSLLPEGCQATEIGWADGRVQWTAGEAAYLFCRGPAIPADYWMEQVDRCRRQLASGEPMVLLRRSPKHPAKPVNLRNYVQEIHGDQDQLRIQCRMDAAGSVRPEELLEWLRIGPADLARPLRRTAVVWMQKVPMRG